MFITFFCFWEEFHMLGHFFAYVVVSIVQKVRQLSDETIMWIPFGVLYQRRDLPCLWLKFIFQYMVTVDFRVWELFFFFFNVLGIEDGIKKTGQISLKSNFIRNGWLKALSQLNSYLQQACITAGRWDSGGTGIGHEVYFFACVILTSYIKNHENLALLEKNIPLKFWPLSAEW